MTAIPKAPGLDNTLAFLREAYHFVGRRCDRLGSDSFRTRIMLTPVVCLRGAAAAQFFYDGERFTRNGAMPQTTLRLLQDKGSVQTLDGAAHRHRKAMFLQLLGPDAVAEVTARLERYWRQALPGWQRAGRVTLLPEVTLLLTRAGCDWAGLPLPEAALPGLARALESMVAQAGSTGPATGLALLRRRRVERRLRQLVEAVRTGQAQAPAGSALAVVAGHRDADGTPLSPDAAAVELINLLRPLVAVNRFILFAALALHEHPAWRPRLLAEPEATAAFAQEVRRFYPFFPVIGGRARQPLDWGGHHFAAGDWVMLDLYGTNHHARLWEAPDEFRPDRFLGWPGDPYTLVPQGAGLAATGHRCPGEALTMGVIGCALRLLCGLDYTVPPQDLRIDMARMPTAPRSGFVISAVRAG